MKAASVVQVHVQHQMTLAGLPMNLIAFSAIGALVALIIPLALQTVVLLIPAPLAGLIITWVFLMRRFRANPFFDKELILAPKFWFKRRHKVSVLSAGGGHQ
ncbi:MULTISPECIES: hypothetical protein [Thalassospira]|uniref:Uncharacterized protein n=1 Tax=Thalassospira profundimaris TaxID=502049 RepID=A0A367X3X2_9PROT|nr:MULTISPECIES: hypothetical protein [Thalassospira]MEE3046400.1 hypothetical protein [Pseudomonadota bacterium]HAI31596.1 hypothetical protein [Thalassospira sp.]KZC98676.1 hypothetical protein AUQ41_15120 [Thalassospira sp. MCCC 1A02898]ONH86821.1 hypothetical protein TH47_14580 [Thalassospira sp. MCCC 1A02803]RCK47760.1 hypothetical protein TH30_04695 [Thalassospira profundimaris]|tara:strand:- start:410 stop:715 length:306 start_codon:yes stop_codon:yes gene_type:complete